LQLRLAHIEREMIERVSIEAEQIDHEVDQRRTVTAMGDHLLQLLKARAAMGEDDGHFAVEPCVSNAEPQGGLTKP
jgi:uncharacterized protein YabN with tetrapyrrole methylase and pyrophosphatase domain